MSILFRDFRARFFHNPHVDVVEEEAESNCVVEHQVTAKVDQEGLACESLYPCNTHDWQTDHEESRGVVFVFVGVLQVIISGRSRQNRLNVHEAQDLGQRKEAE